MTISSRMTCSRWSTTLVIAVIVLLGPWVNDLYSQNPVIIDVGTTLGNDTLEYGVPGAIVFTVDANGNRVAALTFPFELIFSDGNFIDSMADQVNVIPSPEAMARFEHRAWQPQYGHGSNPDSMLYALIDFGGPLWDISGEVFRIELIPKRLGSVQFDSITLPPLNQLSALDEFATDLPVEWRGSGKLLSVTTPEPVIFDIHTTDGNDTLAYGEPGAIVFSVDANGHSIHGLAFPLELVFSQNNFLGPLSDLSNIVPSAEAISRFELRGWSYNYGQGTVPDSLLYGFVDFGGTAWDISGEVFRIEVTPTTPGNVSFNSIWLPPANILSAFNEVGAEMPIQWLGDGKVITVDPPPVLFDIATLGSNDSLLLYNPGAIVFTVDARGNHISGLTFPYELLFSQGNVLGALSYPGNVVPSPEAQARFNSVNWNASYGQGSDPDTMLFSLLDLVGSDWNGPLEMFRIETVPDSRGTLEFDSIAIGPAQFLSAIDAQGRELPIEWQGHQKQLTFAPPPAYIDVLSVDNDPLYVDTRDSIEFWLDANGNALWYVSLPLEIVYSSGNLFGPLTYMGNVIPSIDALNHFAQVEWHSNYGLGNDPDTLLCEFTASGDTPWNTSAKLLHLDVIPLGLGDVSFNEVALPPDYSLTAVDILGGPVPLRLRQNGPISIVQCPVALTGDVNLSGTVTSGDVIYMVNFVFKAEAPPEPCQAAGDTNCDGETTLGDILTLVNFVFKGLEEPCDVCSILSSSWSCP